MSQKLNDFILLVKKDRKTQVIVAVVFVFLMILIFSPSQNKQRVVKKTDTKISSGQTSQREVMDDVMLAVQQDLQTIKQQSADTTRQVQDQQKKSSDYEQRTAEIFKRILEQMADQDAKRVVNGNLPAPSMPYDYGNIGGAAVDGKAMYGAGGNGFNFNGTGSGKTGTDGFNAPPSGLGFNSSGTGSTGSDGLGSASNPSYAGLGSAQSGIQNTGVTDMNYASDGGISEPLEMDTIGFDDKTVVPPPAPQREKVAFVGAGDSVRIKLLAGVNAPTDGTPYPVVFQLSGDITGPDGSTLPLGEGRVIAAAQGSLTDSRALFRLSSLNIRMPSGRHKVIDVDGWVVGEDGIRGMEGVLLDPFGKAIAASGFAGVLQGLGRAASDQQVQRSQGLLGTQEIITGSDTKYAAGKGLGSAASTYSRLVEQRANLLIPHVEVLSGREATAVFSKSFTIKDLLDDLEGEDNDAIS